jgi:GNAT superfamily N-acetyltransferase
MSNTVPSPEVAAKLAEIGREPVNAIWTAEYEGTPSAQDTVVLGLPYECWYSGTLATNLNRGLMSGISDASTCWIRGQLEVAEELRENKIATRLVQAMSYLALKYGATVSWGKIDSPYTVRIHRKIFGDENIKFYEHTIKSPDKLIALPLDTDQAIEFLDGSDGEDLVMIVDLSNTSMDDLEKPVEDGAPLFIRRED